MVGLTYHHLAAELMDIISNLAGKRRKMGAWKSVDIQIYTSYIIDY